jgi:phosphatidylserine/phosphatidylglycerophosphate/cardiolipin synthase-like enzyme
MFSHAYQIITKDDASIHFLSFANALTTAIRAARHRVWILSYVINANLSKQNDPVTLIMAILRTRHATGCDVRFILDNPQINRPNYHCNKFFMRRLMEWGFQFQTPPPRISSHAKAVLIDSSVLFIGSHNLAASSLTNPLDCTVELRNAFLIQSFAETYKMLWQNSTMVSYKPEDVPPAEFYG